MYIHYLLYDLFYEVSMFRSIGDGTFTYNPFYYRYRLPRFNNTQVHTVSSTMASDRTRQLKYLACTSFLNVQALVMLQ